MISTVTLAGLRAVAHSIAEESARALEQAGTGPLARDAEIALLRCLTVIAVMDCSPDVLERAAMSLPAARVADAVPPHIKAGLDRYAALGLRPGHCMYAVLCNDLRGAFAHADAETAAAMPAIITYINSALPCGCWGSPLAVDAWIQMRRVPPGGAA